MDKKKIGIYVLIGIVASAVVFGAMYYFTQNKNGEQSKEIAIKYQTYEYDLGEFSTNLGSTRSFFKGHIVIEVLDETLLEKLPQKNAAIRDGVISILIGRTSDKLLSPEGQSELKKEIIEMLSKIAGENRVTNVYFKEYIVQ